MRYRAHFLACAAFAVGGVALPTSAYADYKGFFLIIDPYDTGNCAASINRGKGPSWLTSSTCDPRGVIPNPVPNLIY